jgi:hypothetical protein
MEQKDEPGFRSVIVTLFCLAASLGAGFSIQKIVDALTGWQVLLYGLGAGIFIAISVLVLNQALSAFRDH